MVDGGGCVSIDRPPEAAMIIQVPSSKPSHPSAHIYIYTKHIPVLGGRRQGRLAGGYPAAGTAPGPPDPRSMLLAAAPLPSLGLGRHESASPNLLDLRRSSIHHPTAKQENQTSGGEAENKKEV
jgi:hypothetical protein